LSFSPAIALLIAVCTSQWRNRTTASMRSETARASRKQRLRQVAQKYKASHLWAMNFRLHPKHVKRCVAVVAVTGWKGLQMAAMGNQQKGSQ
jgi:hypothetical protein